MEQVAFKWGFMINIPPSFLKTRFHPLITLQLKADFSVHLKNSCKRFYASKYTLLALPGSIQTPFIPLQTQLCFPSKQQAVDLTYKLCCCTTYTINRCAEHNATVFKTSEIINIPQNTRFTPFSTTTQK